MNESDPLYSMYNDQITKMEKMVTSLNAFHSQTRALDANHQAQVSNLNTIIQSLFENSDTFTGSAANTLQDVVSQYLQAEHSFTGHPGDTSPHLAEATRYSQTTATNIQHELDALYKDASNYSDQLAKISSESFVQQEATYILEGPFGNNQLASDVQAYANGQCFLPPETPQHTSQMLYDEEIWGGNMGTLAQEPLPVLPPIPTDPKPLQADPNSILYPTNNQSLDNLTIKRIAEELRNEGYIVDDAQVAALWNAGYRNPEDIKAHIKGGAKNSFVDDNYQRTKAAQISVLAANARANGTKSSNYGGGYLELRDANGTIVYNAPIPIKEGKQGAPVDRHSETQTIDDIVNRLQNLKTQGRLANVKVINVLIFTRIAPCDRGSDTCASRMNDTTDGSRTGWIPRIRAAAGTNNIVLTTWYMQDRQGKPTEDNLQQSTPIPSNNP